MLSCLNNSLDLVQRIKKSLKALPRFGYLFKMLANNISPEIKDLLHLIMTQPKRSLRFFLLILDLLVGLNNLLLIGLGWKKLRVNLLTILLRHNKFQVVCFSQCWLVLSNPTKLFGAFRNYEISWNAKTTSHRELSF